MGLCESESCGTLEAMSCDRFLPSMSDTLSTDSRGRLARIPEQLAMPIGMGILIVNTTQYTFNKTLGGLIMPGSENDDFDKKYRFGEVIAVGNTVPDRVEVGDIVVYQTTTAFRMPNGQEVTHMWRVIYSEISIMLVLPNLDPKKMTDKWKNHPGIKTLAAERKQWLSGEEKERK